ncbi:MAG TPA: DUF1592 domain-containing protein [Pirellulales bacterium]|jgi:mono/diheme cytochrome c family protein|nr:DUF1592 domain-containing protein [Pirellulales bacterium]
MVHRLGFIVLALRLAWLAPPCAMAGPAPEDKNEAAFREGLQGFLTKYCADCHGGTEPEKNLALEKLPSADERDVWTKVRKYLQGRIMPPKDAGQPTAAEFRTALAAIDAHLAGSDCGLKRNPGRVTIRRLNRTEYDNTVRDLVGVDFHPAADFPADDVGYGFDQIGDVLSMPPILLEKYLAAADQIVDRAIYVHTPEKTPRQTYPANKVQHEGGNNRSNCWELASTGSVYTDIELPARGEYMLRGKAFATQAGNELAKMAFKLDDQQVYVADVAAEQGAAEVYETKVHAKPGKHRFALAFINDFYDPQNPDPKRRDRNLWIESLEVQGPLDAPPPELPDSHKKIIFCEPKKGELRECAEKVLSRFASRAFRRPATPQEVERLIKLVELARSNGESFERGIQLAMEAVLVSPHFLFRVEQDPEPAAGGANGVHEISEYELATRLSYFLYSSMPDDGLLHDSFKGRLRKNLDKQVARMLKDPKSRALVDNFATQWLEIRRLQNVTPDAKLFPAFDDELRQAMLEETKRFFAAIIEEDRGVLDLLDADFTFLNERLAKHYRIPGVTGPEFRRVKLDDPDRGGLVTQASVLTATSNPTRTSPVKRGKWILEVLLDMPPPPPPPNASDLKDEGQVVASGSLRQRMEQHRANPSCASCHTLMDPLGFGLENFDAVGGWRDREGPFAIDASGELPDGSAFKGPRELKAILKQKKDDFVRCLSAKMLTYALGRGLEAYDRCAVDDISAAVAQGDYKFSALIHAIVSSDPFQKRGSR